MHLSYFQIVVNIMRYDRFQIMKECQYKNKWPKWNMQYRQVRLVNEIKSIWTCGLDVRINHVSGIYIDLKFNI